MDAPILLLDQDGPLADYPGAIKTFLSDAGYERDAYSTYSGDSLADIRSIFGGAAADAFKAARETVGFYRDLKPTLGAISAVTRLLDEGIRVVICTTPIDSVSCIPEKLDWVERFLPSLRTSVVVTHDKTLVRGTVLLDDKPLIRGLLQPVWRHIRFTCKGWGGPTDSLSMSGWDDIDGLLRVLTADLTDVR